MVLLRFENATRTILPRAQFFVIFMNYTEVTKFLLQIVPNDTLKYTHGFTLQKSRNDDES